jgi:hypothetical protein
MDLKCYKNNNANKFDFILDSLVLSIGNQTSIKCLFDKDDRCKISFSKCWAKILDELIYSNEKQKDPIVFLLNKTLQSFHNTNTSSCKSALTLTILLWKLLNQKLLDLASEDRYNHHVILSYLNVIFNKSLDKLVNNSDIVKKLEKNDKKISRFLKNEVIFVDEDFYKNLISGLCRSQSQYSDLIWSLFKYNNYKNICLDKISFLINDSLDFNDDQWYLIKSGILFEEDDKECDINDGILNSLVVDAHLFYNYTHLGFNKDIKYEKLVKFNGFDIEKQRPSYQKTWLEYLKSVLIKNNIKLLIISGSIDRELEVFCIKERIFVLKCLNAEKFKLVKDYFEFVKILVYIEDFSEDCVFQCKFENTSSRNYVCIKSMLESDVVSVLVKKNNEQFLLKSQIKMFVEELKHYIKKFENVLNDKAYLVNDNGTVELYFAGIISGISCNSVDDEVYFCLAREILFETFINYHNLVSCNIDKIGGSILVYDDLTSKVQAWKLALDINKLFLNIDLSLTS